MKVICQGHTYDIRSDAIQVYNQLIPQVYNVRFHKMKGFFLEKGQAIEIKEDKIYGVHNKKVGKVLDSFQRSNRNLGVILSGDKGIGKSLFAKLLSQNAIACGCPLIIVDTYIPGIASYIESIEQECVIMFDEFDKTFGDVRAEDGSASPQTEMLTLFDGMAGGKKLFVITCNELRKLSEFLVNRPGRFHYHFRFEYPSVDEIREYLKDKLPEEFHGEISDVIAFSRKVKLNYDCLRSIAFEIASGSSFREAILDLNIINMNEDRYTVAIHYANGLIGSSRNVRLDMFGDGENVCTWLEDKSGYSFVRASFNPSKACWSDKMLANVVSGNDIGVYYPNYDEDEPEVKSLVEAAKSSSIVGIVIKPEYGSRMHYAF